jgi:hypothetical protein
VETLGYLLQVPSEAMASSSDTTRFCSRYPEDQRQGVNGDIALAAQNEVHSAQPSVGEVILTVLRRVRVVAKISFFVVSIRPYVRVSFRLNRLGSHWTDFR